MDRFDKYWIGIVIGLSLPLLFGWIYVAKYNLWEVLRSYEWSGIITSKLLMLACFPDMATIFLFYTTDTWRLSKGIVVGMLPYLLASIWMTI